MAQQRQVRCRHHLGSRVVIDTPLAGHDPSRQTACSSEPLDALAAGSALPTPDSQADGTTSLALVREIHHLAEGRDALKKRRVLRLAR